MNTLVKLNNHWLDNFLGDEYFTPTVYEPKTDIQETENGYAVTIDLPGYSDDEVNVELKENKMTITAEHKEEKEEKDVKYLYRERKQHSYRRVFVLPVYADGENIAAALKNGVLTLDIPKKEEVKPRQITIK